MSVISQDVDRRIAESLEAILLDHSRFSSRIREVVHTVKSAHSNITLRLHYPSFRSGKPTIAELVNTLSYMTTHFCIPRAQIRKLKLTDLDDDQKIIEFNKLYQQSLELFKQAQKITNRNGEAGEILLFILTEWILQAPQILAKMSLKTNPNMPVHGADGVHVRYCTDTASLNFYWGESKLYADFSAGLRSAVQSITDALDEKALAHELELVKNNIDLSGIDEVARDAIIKYLDPFEECYNSRRDIVTCLIGFDFDKYSELAVGVEAENEFREFAGAELKRIEPQLSRAFSRAELLQTEIQLFVFPLPSVQDFRDRFQSVIGWSK